VAFPASAVTDSFVRVSASPSAQADYVGAVTRRPFVQGEPIITTAVIQPDGRGFMAAQLEPGYRAVAVQIEQGNAVGGYIQPNDRVDVIVALKVEGGENNQVRSDTIIEGARVLAVGDKTQPQTVGESPEIINAADAVLELTIEDARALAQAQKVGDISLALRGVQIETVGLTRSGRTLSQGAGTVRIHAFGAVTGGSR
jgi:pilus assembly protein CpaB